MRQPQDLVGVGSFGQQTDSSLGYLPGQWPEEFRSPETIHEKACRICRLVGIGVASDLLSSVPQQIQPDRALLVLTSEEVERRDTEVLDNRRKMRSTDEVERYPSYRPMG